MINGKAICKRIIDKLLLENESELAGKSFLYDGENCLFTLGPLRRTNFAFTVVLEETRSRCINFYNFVH